MRKHPFLDEYRTLEATLTTLEKLNWRKDARWVVCRKATGRRRPVGAQAQDKLGHAIFSQPSQPAELLQELIHRECIAFPFPSRPSTSRGKCPVWIQARRYPSGTLETPRTRCRSNRHVIHQSRIEWRPSYTPLRETVHKNAFLALQKAELGDNQ